MTKIALNYYGIIIIPQSFFIITTFAHFLMDLLKMQTVSFTKAITNAVLTACVCMQAWHNGYNPFINIANNSK